VEPMFRACESPIERQFLLGMFLRDLPFGMKLAEPDTEAKELTNAGAAIDFVQSAESRADPQNNMRPDCVSVVAQRVFDDWQHECEICDDLSTCEHASPVVARVDFLLSAYWFGPVGWITHVAVEIDGHEFHDRTKEQAAKDRARDRWLLSDHFGPDAVIRFTGSEVFSDPSRCAQEAFLCAYNLFQRRHEGLQVERSRALTRDPEATASPQAEIIQ
jgi:hypothetical protein